MNGANDYVIDFPASELPDSVVSAYWSIILVDVPNYRVVPNSLNRFNFNSYSGLEANSDGALSLLIASKPSESLPESNWLPAPEDKNFSLTLRTYVPKDAVKQGRWFPPAVKKLGE